MIDVAITGAAGRMGQRLIALAKQEGVFNVVGAIERPGHTMQALDAGEVAGIGAIGVPITFELKPRPAVLIDFSSPEGTRHWLKVCRDRGIALVIGTTGLTAADQESIDLAAAEIPILASPNMSFGVAVLFRVAAEVTRLLGEDYDVEIIEGHHRFKKDAPSGTALGLADAIVNARGKGREILKYDRHGDDTVRQKGDVGIHALRMGDEIGRHVAHFGGMGERIELTHVATSRDTFARGALKVAAWIATKGPGRYKMSDVLGI